MLGAGGWVGSALVAALQRQGQPVRAVSRVQLTDWLAEAHPARVIYGIGLTADFRERPYATVEAHVGLLSRVLQRQGLQAFTYLSSTRVYGRSACTREDAALPCLSSDPSDLYNLSKLLGEALVLRQKVPTFRVVRLSNVVGPAQPEDTFLGQLLFEGCKRGAVRIRQPAASIKDYVALEDVVRLLPQITQQGMKRLYNLASGTNVSHAEVAELLRERGWHVALADGQEQVIAVMHDRISIERLAAEFEAPSDGLRACRSLILGDD